MVTILELPAVQDQPALFSTFLMWLLADLFQELPEVGDLDKPKLVFFFDEAHLLFKDASKAFLESITQTVRLIRSKGVGVFFVTQTPKDVPADVLAQLGNRVQHALRAFTPDDAKALKATVSTFPKSALRPGGGAHPAGHRRGGRHGAVTRRAPRRPVAWTRLRAPAVADGGRSSRRVMAARSPASPLRREVRAGGRPGVGVREARRPARPTARPGRPHPRPRPPLPHRPAPNRSLAEQILGSRTTKRLLTTAAAAAGTAIIRSIFGTRRR